MAKGVLTGPDQLHISYVHSPIRYAWDLQGQYLKGAGLDHGLKGWLAKIFLHYIRMWDVRTANGVDFFIANSQFIAKRIWKCYRREAEVIYPPVDIAKFTLREQKEEFYLAAARMVPYKKMDLIVTAFNHLPDKKLVVIGAGPELSKVRKLAGANIELLGYQTDAVLKDYMQRAKAFVFAAEDDFGIMPVEAQACGTPVIAYGRGGALETVRGLNDPQPTGAFFAEQTINSLQQTIQDFEAEQKRIDPRACRKQAEKFGVKRFQQEFKLYAEEKLRGINK